MNKTSYHLPQPLPDPQNINELLSPLFKTVKTKKINSFLQFKNHSNELS